VALHGRAWSTMRMLGCPRVVVESDSESEIRDIFKKLRPSSSFMVAWVCAIYRKVWICGRLGVCYIRCSVGSRHFTMRASMCPSLSLSATPLVIPSLVACRQSVHLFAMPSLTMYTLTRLERIPTHRYYFPPSLVHLLYIYASAIMVHIIMYAIQ
jgi:hypothetical protein